ncbi:hypothetical protein AVEN_209723-1 [Araneus ventricosus]|uniref:Uncharacterized protein n=1 Tax=Araneus ventricosus TaxID=182803 RepID=A0A4Y2RL41_ARAVE|nr:hypothetical protein AVEN_209723-1 [Araneus ventricosus]
MCGQPWFGYGRRKKTAKNRMYGRPLREMTAARKWRRTARVAVAYASNARFQLMYIVQFSHMEESQCWIRNCPACLSFLCNGVNSRDVKVT